jgi:hypothetical protein
MIYLLNSWVSMVMLNHQGYTYAYVYININIHNIDMYLDRERERKEPYFILRPRSPDGGVNWLSPRYYMTITHYVDSKWIVKSPLEYNRTLDHLCKLIQFVNLYWLTQGSKNITSIFPSSIARFWWISLSEKRGWEIPYDCWMERALYGLFNPFH